MINTQFMTALLDKAQNVNVIHGNANVANNVIFGLTAVLFTVENFDASAIIPAAYNGNRPIGYAGANPNQCVLQVIPGFTIDGSAVTPYAEVELLVAGQSYWRETLKTEADFAAFLTLWTGLINRATVARDDVKGTMFQAFETALGASVKRTG